MKILIAMPTATWSIPSEMDDYFHAIEYPEWCKIWKFKVKKKEICLARNQYLVMAIRDNYDYIWFLDDDNVPNQLNALEILLSYKKDIICWLVPTRERINGVFNLCIYDKKLNDYGMHSYEPRKTTPTEELTSVSACGMWCVLVSRNCFEKLYRKYQACPFEMRNMRYYLEDKFIKSEDDLRHQHVDTKIKYCRFVSESILFSERAKKEWFEIFATNKVTCNHIWENEIINIDFHCDTLNNQK